MSNKRFLKKLLLIPIILLASLNSAYAPVHAEEFNDVDAGDRYYVAISTLRDMGIIDGYQDGNFYASESINRAEALKMITLAMGVIDSEALPLPEFDPFSDVPKTEWYGPYVKAAKDLGIVDGNPDGSFDPAANINLAEALKILLKSYKPNSEYQVLDQYLYSDTPADSWFTAYTSYAAAKEAINIYADNGVSPEQEMTRGYLAEIIYRLLKSEEGYGFGKATFYGKAVHGNGTASGETFDYTALTAAHKTLPFGTIVKVTNMANGESVEVKINDRGPYGPGRVIDLSEAAFDAIASLGAGVITVQYQIISQPE